MVNVLVLIQKFKSGNASESEKKELLEKLTLNEQEFKNWLETDYRTDIIIDVQILSKDLSAEIFNKIQQLKNRDINIGSSNERVKIISIASHWLRWASAACVIGIIASAIWFFNSSQKASSTIYTTAKTQTHLKQYINNTNKTILAVLEDGSTVSIEPRSAISYYSPFVSKRDISLTGKATFKVAKDAAKPFTVYASGISTTALGTKFSVDNFNNKVLIKLLSGLVVVRSAGAKIKIAVANTYLKPGQQYFFNIQKGAYTVSSFKVFDPINHVFTARSSKPQAKVKEAVVLALSFNKTILSEVFSKISKQYNQLIQYNKEDFGSASFTGSFLPSDSLQTILTLVCKTNDLSFKEEKGIIIISK